MNEPPLRVLIVDDDEEQLILRSMLLQRAGFIVTYALDSPSALRRAATERPHCAILDLRLPTEDAGLHLIRELKNLNGEIRLFILTGANPHRLSSQPEVSLVDEIFQKPTSSGSLTQRLKLLESQLCA